MTASLFKPVRRSELMRDDRDGLEWPIAREPALKQSAAKFSADETDALRILIAEDKAGNQAVLTSLSSTRGHVAEAVSNGRERWPH